MRLDYMTHVVQEAGHFQARILAKCSQGSPDECWPWLGEINRDGYGVISIGGRHNRVHPSAHRISYLAFVGGFDKELVVDHLCRNRTCVNPAHLEPVTIGENVLRGISLPAVAARSTACRRGHEWTPENTHTQHKKDGRTARICRTCVRASEAARKERAA
jgi:hypothetical protein